MSSMSRNIGSTSVSSAIFLLYISSLIQKRNFGLNEFKGIEWIFNKYKYIEYFLLKNFLNE